MNTKRVAAIFALLITSVLHAAAPATRQWTIGDLTREAVIVAPDSAQKQASALIFAFHGHGGKARGFEKALALEDAWPQAIIVYPQGVPTPGRIIDREGKLPGWQSAPGEQGDRDLKFFNAMLDSLRHDYKIDEDRIYATGHSNGGTFTYVLWQSRGKDFAAFAPIASAYGFAGIGPQQKFKDVVPRPIFHIAGRNDPLVKFDWQEKTIDLMRQLNHCSDGKPWPADNRCTLYTSPDNSPVLSYIHDGGHEIPRDAREMIVKFFKENTKPATPPAR